MLISYAPLLVCIIGILMWALCSSGVLREIGRWSYAIGLFVTTQTLMTHTVHVGNVLIAPVPILLFVIGLLLWVLPKPHGEEPPQSLLRQAAKIACLIGLFWVVESLAGHTTKIG